MCAFVRFPAKPLRIFACSPHAKAWRFGHLVAELSHGGRSGGPESGEILVRVPAVSRFSHDRELGSARGPEPETTLVPG